MAISLPARLRQNKKAWVARKTLDRFNTHDVWWDVRDSIESRLRDRLWSYVVQIYSGIRRKI